MITIIIITGLILALSLRIWARNTSSGHLGLFRPYSVSFTREMVLNEHFINHYGGDWMAGRMEISLPYYMYPSEFRFFTNKPEFELWMDKHEGKHYSSWRTKRLIRELKEKYNHIPSKP